MNKPVQYLVLLRGINVGGNNIIKMADLKSCFESAGFKEVRTYIQSGNIIFVSPEKIRIKLVEKIEKMLSDIFKYNAKVVLVTDKELKNVVNDAPPDFGKDPEKFRYDVIFLKEPLTAEDAMKNVRVKEGVDQAYQGNNVLYFSRLAAKAAQSYLGKITGMPEYKNMTIRNWNTTAKLLAMMEKGIQ
jgi:uncharacterized protein (DUF1697 family)